MLADLKFVQGSVIKTGSQARRDGDKYYFTGQPCKNGHLGNRYASSGACIICDKARVQLERRLDRDTYNAYQRNWASKNKDLVSLYNYEQGLRNGALRTALEAKRKAELLKRTPSWADYKKIKQFYANCPSGYTVDHVIPLQGKLVCGLHVENNLQYLTASDNSSKGNRYVV